ncbi:NifB/NifX family molybdenum-iron cluster-binding protein [Thiomicrorhabdus sp. Milos-T2]|uniref:NifB/NifX family molybdenum-iron cluster-binding protein n=1 Tax=Thiomicrorhabdus sp. Milos-T2 TaxID=90814 RepID=UPI00068D9E1B|nr:NifB/NifX family molybdenum-iron cluster-binding protein [Thiomicrorhabdus sp. Milos-T2]
MKIAITSPNAKTIAGHAGKCPGYLIFEVEDGEIMNQYHIKLSKEQVFKNFSGPLSKNPQHPLNGINAFITQGLGDGLKQRLAKDQINAYTTELTNPEEAVQAVINCFHS